MKDNLTTNASNEAESPAFLVGAVMPSCLRIPLKTKWFEMTKAGIKKEDYREITPYWVMRLTQCEIDPIVAAKELNAGSIYFKAQWDLTARLPMHFYPKKFDYNVMTLGYPKNGDMEKFLRLEHKGIEIRTGNPEWGAEPNKLYFVIMHGAILA